MLRRLVQQAASVAGLRVVGTGLSVCVTVAIARLFGSDALGVYAYCVALLAIVAVPVSNGWSTMLLRSVSATGRLDAASLAMARMGGQLAIGVALLASAGAAIAINLGSSDVARMLQPVAVICVPLLALTLLCDQVSALRMASLRGIDRPALGQLPEMLLRPSLILLGLGLAWLWLDRPGEAGPLPYLFGALAGAALLAALFGIVILLRYAPKGNAEKPTVDRKGWIASAAALAGSAGLVQLNGYIDLLILGGFEASAQIGIYRAALQISMLASFGYVALNMLAGQRFSKLRAQGDRAGLNRTATWLARLSLLAALPLPLLLLVAGDGFFTLVFGTEFAAAAVPALIVASGLTFSGAIGMARTLLVMHHREFLVMRATLAALAINVVACIVLIPEYGVLGAACANFASTVAWNLILWVLAIRQTGIDTSAIGLPMRPGRQERTTATE